MARARARSLIEDGPPAEANEGAVTRCLVYCRVRPSFPRDFEDGAYQLLTLNGKNVSVKDERSYEFDGTFQGDSRQEDVFRSIALPCIQHAFKGFCSALMCYGQTGTGKSFTMCCTKPGHEGIIPQAAVHIFKTIQRDPSRKYTVHAEFIQIYRDQLGDLMTESGKDRVDIHFDPNDGVTLPGCSTHELSSPEAFMAFYNEGDKRRVVTATAMNPESSRGHTALVVRIKSIPIEDECAGTVSGKVTFIDLAGYERFSKTGISNANTVMKDEAKTINASLLSLGHVVTSLSNGDKHIPWRNSKLTRLLQDSIGGRSRTTIILTVGPSSDHLHESANTLQFGLRAMAVKVQAKVTLTVDYEKLAAKLQAMLEEKNARISDLEIQAAANDAERLELTERHRRDQEGLELRHAEELEAARNSGATADELFNITKHLTLEASALKEQQEEEVTYHEEQHQKDMIQLFEEEKKRASRNLEQERMMRERAVEELQQRLEDARGGGNKDLEKALHELAERDMTLASRAADIDRLQTLCTRLADQVREAGGEPDGIEEMETSLVVDVSQVEEMKKRYEAELAATKNQVADLRRAMEEASSKAAGRAEEAEGLRKALKELQDKHADDVVEELMNKPPSPMPEEPRVDVEALKATLQSDIDFWRARAGALQQQLDDSKKEKAAAGTPRGALKGRPDANSATPSQKQQGDMQLRLEKLLTENFALAEQLQQQQQPSAGAGGGGTDGTSRLQQLLQGKDAQIEDAMQLVQQRERQLADAKRHISALKAHVSKGGQGTGRAPLGVDDEPTSAPNDSFGLLGPSLNSASVTLSSLIGPEGVDLTQFMHSMAALRKRNRELEQLVVANAPLDAKELLDHRDAELQDRDETILRLAAEIETLTTAVARLERQVEDSGDVPVCRLSADKRASVDAELQTRFEEMSRRQQELEADVARKASEKQKVAALLQTLNSDRMQEAAMYEKRTAELEEKVRKQEMELAQREQASAAANNAATIALKQKVSQDEQAAAILRAQIQENTKQMMEAQARLALEREEQANGGFFSKLRKKFN
jgi:hypothetical protein